MYHVPEIRINLVSGSLINRNGFKLVLEANKFVLSKRGAYFGKGYLYEGMFKLSVINKKSISAYVIESPSILWYNRFGHVNSRRIHNMVNLNLLPKFNIKMDKCTTCMLTKITRKVNVEENSKILELIHSDLCDLHGTPSLGGNKYFMTLMMIIVDIVMFIY